MRKLHDIARYNISVTLTTAALCSQPLFCQLDSSSCWVRQADDGLHKVWTLDTNHCLLQHTTLHAEHKACGVSKRAQDAFRLEACCATSAPRAQQLLQKSCLCTLLTPPVAGVLGHYCV